VFVDASATKSVEPPVIPEPERKYQRVLDYGTWVKDIRYEDKRLPQDSRGVMAELAEAFDLAADKIHDLNSERTHLFNIMITADDVLDKVPDSILSRKQLDFLVDLLQTLQEAYEVVEFGDDRDEKDCLPPRPHLGQQGKEEIVIGK
jgi:hypothetical protein